MKALILGSFLLLSSAAFADIAGQQMDCSYLNSVTGDTDNTTYIFHKAPNGQNVAEVFSTTAGQDLLDYDLVGTKLTIEDGGDARVYDISNPAHITRKFQVCVSPGVPDGDSKPICALSLETCQLH